MRQRRPRSVRVPARVTTDHSQRWGDQSALRHAVPLVPLTRHDPAAPLRRVRRCAKRAIGIEPTTFSMEARVHPPEKIHRGNNGPFKHPQQCFRRCREVLRGRTRRHRGGVASDADCCLVFHSRCSDCQLAVPVTTTGSTGTYGVPRTPSCCSRMTVSETPRGLSARLSAKSFGAVSPQSVRISRALAGPPDGTIRWRAATPRIRRDPFDEPHRTSI